MSRMFELLRQAQRDQSLLKRPSPLVTTHSQNFEVLLRSGLDDQLFETEPVPAAASTALVSPAPGGILRGETAKLVQQLFFTPGCPSPKVLVFCAVEQGHERGWIGPKVAEQIANSSRASVCIVDANVGRPSLHSYFGVENTRGFSAALSDPDPVKKFAQRVGQDDLWFMPAGEPPSIADLSSKSRFEKLPTRINELRGSFHHVLVDAPPSTTESLAACLASLADGVVLIVEQSFTPRAAVRGLKDEIETAGGRVLGVVMHRRPLSLSERADSRRSSQGTKRR